MQIAKGKTTMKIQRLSSLKDWFWITDLTNGLQPASSISGYSVQIHPRPKLVTEAGTRSEADCCEGTPC